MKFRLFSLILLIALALVSVVPLAAQDAPQGFPLTVVDGLGRELTFDAPPQRVVALYNGNFGNMATLGVRPVATLANPTMLADPRYFEDGEAIPLVTSTDGGIDLETVAAAEPDLIMAFSLEEVQSMETIAPVYVPLDTNSLDGLYSETRQLAAILGVSERAEAAISAFEDRLAAYEMLAQREVSVMLAGPTGDDLNAIRLRTEFSPDCQLLNRIAICDWADPTDGEFWSYETTPETLLELNPDFIYYWRAWNGTQSELLAFVRENPLWAELDAVQNGRVLHVQGYVNPIASSLIAATQLLDTFAPLLYPDIFPDGPLTDEQVAEILAGEGAASTYSITDVNGNMLTFDAPPTRFVSGGNRDIEMLAALGIVPAAIPDVPFLIEMMNNPVYFPQPVEFEIIPIDQDTFELDLEALLAFAPDVVFGSDEQRAAAAGLDLNVYAFYANNGPGTWQQGLEELRKLAALTGREEQAEAVIAQFEDRLAAYTALAPRDRSVMLVGAASATEFYISTEVSGRCAIIREVATCPWPDPTGGASWSYITSLEGLLELDPDVIILDNWGNWSNEEMNAELAASPLWNELTAVQTGRVTPILESYNYVQGVGPIGNMRWLDLYMPVIYPEVFPDGPLTDE